MTWLKIGFGWLGTILGGRMIYLYLLISAGLLSSGYYAGRTFCNNSWQTAKSEALEEALAEAHAWQQKHAKAQNELAESRANRKEKYREKIKGVTAGAPDCSLDRDRLQELVCAVSPSTCKR
jgi:ABC-type nitrate/sulfonate/bicarbonate transport system substrate-binding protein